MKVLVGVARFATFPLFGLIAGFILGVREIWAWAPGEYPMFLVIVFMPFTLSTGLWGATWVWAVVEVAMLARHRAPRRAPVAAVVAAGALGAGFALAADATAPDPLVLACLLGLAAIGPIIVTLAIRGRPRSLAPPNTGTLAPDRRL